jgi:hypothetical protein
MRESKGFDEVLSGSRRLSHLNMVDKDTRGFGYVTDRLSSLYSAAS